MSGKPGLNLSFSRDSGEVKPCYQRIITRNSPRITDKYTFDNVLRNMRLTAPGVILNKETNVFEFDFTAKNLYIHTVESRPRKITFTLPLYPAVFPATININGRIHNLGKRLNTFLNQITGIPPRIDTENGKIIYTFTSTKKKIEESIKPL